MTDCLCLIAEAIENIAGAIVIIGFTSILAYALKRGN